MSKGNDQLSSYDQVMFSNSCLELCLVQVKYPAIQRFFDEKYMIDIKEALTEEYPLVNTEQGMNIVITPQGVNQTPGAPLLRFISIYSHMLVEFSNEC